MLMKASNYKHGESKVEYKFWEDESRGIWLFAAREIVKDRHGNTVAIAANYLRNSPHLLRIGKGSVDHYTLTADWKGMKNVTR